tara:strand:- start:965 stop:1150 length:186 start_codon:yes stop_codon:yes gene_type:complete
MEKIKSGSSFISNSLSKTFFLKCLTTFSKSDDFFENITDGILSKDFGFPLPEIRTIFRFNF